MSTSQTTWPERRVTIVHLDIPQDEMSNEHLPAACAEAGLGAPHRDSDGQYWSATTRGIRTLVARDR